MKTYNNRPYSVPSPSNEDGDYTNFIYNNWSGLNENKNVLSVDQNSFSDCSNVYVDEEGLLRSRPSISLNDEIYSIVEKAGLNLYNYNISEFKSYGDVFAIAVNNKWYIIRNDKYFVCDYSNPIFVYHKKNFFIITSSKIQMLTDEGIRDADDEIYIPVTKSYSNEDEELIEAPNEICKFEYIRYLYGLNSSVNFRLLNGKDIIVKIGDKKYELKYYTNAYLSFVNRVRNYESFNSFDVFYYDEETYLSTVTIPLVFTDSSCETSIICNAVRTSIVDENSYDIYYSSDSVRYNALPFVSGVIGLPVLSKDGNFAIVFKQDGPYIISLFATEPGTYTYSSWTNLLQYIEFTSDSKCGVDFTKVKYINSCFIDDVDFVIFYEKDDVLSALTYSNKTFTNNSILFKGIYAINSSNVFSVEGNSSKLDDVNKILSTFDDGSLSVTLTITFDGSMSYFYNNVDVSKISFELNVSYKGNTFVSYIGNPYSSSDVSVTDSNIIFGSCYFNMKNAVLERNRDNKFLYSFRISDITLSILNSSDGSYKIFSRDGSVLRTYFSKTNIGFTSSNDMFLSNVDCTLLEDKLVSCICFDSNKSSSSKKISLIAYSPGGIFGDFNCMCLLKEITSSSYAIQCGLSMDSDILHFSYSDNDKYLNDVTLSLFIDTKPDVNPTKHSHKAEGFIKCSSVSTLTSSYILLGNNKISLLFNCSPLAISNNNKIYICDEQYVYTNKLLDNKVIEITLKNEIQDYSFSTFDRCVNLGLLYLIRGNSLYISSDVGSSLYFPTSNKLTFDSIVHDVHNISSTEVAVFTDNGVFVICKTEDGVYYYLKSKMSIDCKSGNNVISSYDGKYTLYSSSRGLLAMSYENYVASTDQVLTYLSDNILKSYESFSNNAVKICNYKFYYICYNEGKNFYIFDSRNSSWWKFDFNYYVKNVTIVDNEITFLYKNKICKFNYDFDDYFDLDNDKINWSFTSQKLHLNAITNYKNILGISLSSQISFQEEMLNDLNIKLYRGIVNDVDAVSIDYSVNDLRTFVKRLNYFKVNNLQFTLKSNNSNGGSSPLSLNTICIKYSIKGQVR